MTDFDYDLFVIGAGSGGVRASRIAASHGARVAVAEEFRVGGTCVIRGCVPKKLLVYGAHFAEDLSDARRFGWDVPAVWSVAINISQAPSVYRLLMRPSNAVCDAMHITDEGERGMIRMLVNMMLLSLIGVAGFIVMMGAG
mgnify:CR=1 FL=1